MNTQQIENYTYEDYKFLFSEKYDTEWSKPLTELEFNQLTKFKYVMIAPVATHHNTPVKITTALTAKTIDEIPAGEIFHSGFKCDVSNTYIVYGVYYNW